METPLAEHLGEPAAATLRGTSSYVPRHAARLRSRAEPGTFRGVLWMLVISADLFLMSNPLIFFDYFGAALRIATLITVAAVVFTFPWVRVPRVALPVSAFVGWMLASSSWSIQPSITGAAWAQLLVVTSVAVLVYTNVSARVLVYGLVLGGAAVSATSVYAFQARLPGGYYIPLDVPLLTGIGTNPAILAYTLAVSMCALCAVIPRGTLGRLAWLSAFALVGYGLLEADSSTGDITWAAIVITAALLVGYGPVKRRFFRTRRGRISAGVTMAAVGVLALVCVTKLLGQDLLTFSDRTSLWNAAISVWQDRPIAGYGYSAVWLHAWAPYGITDVLQEIWSRSDYPLNHGHNSAIDLLVETGLVGVVLWGAVMWVALSRTRSLMRTVEGDGIDAPIRSRFTVLCLVYLLLFGMTEPLATIPLGWWVLVLLTEPVGSSRVLSGLLARARRPGGKGNRE